MAAICTTVAHRVRNAQGEKWVNSYVKVRNVGRGSYGKVALYMSAENGRHYAVKVSVVEMRRAPVPRTHASRSLSLPLCGGDDAA